MADEVPKESNDACRWCASDGAQPANTCRPRLSFADILAGSKALDTAVRDGGYVRRGQTGEGLCTVPAVDPVHPARLAHVLFGTHLRNAVAIL